MGIGSEYVEREDLLVVVWHGLVTRDDWNQFVRRQLAADPRWPTGRRRLADITTFDPSEMTADDIATVASLYGDRVVNMVGSRQAIVATHAWDLARGFERAVNQFGVTTIVFNRLERACEWLDVDPVATARVVDSVRATLRDG